MSALTKIAVVLLVIASLLLSAGTIVFVNKIEEFQTTVTAAKADRDREMTAHNTTKQLLTANQQDLLTTAQAANARESALRKERDDLNAKMLEMSATLTKADQDKKSAEVNAQTIAAALQASQNQNTAYQQQVSELRQYRDKLVEERFALNTQLTDAIAKVNALETARKGAEEKAAGLQGRYDGLVARVQSAGMKVDELPQRQVGGPALEGVVKAVFQAGGRPWAAISLGGKDNVTKGMRFNIHNDQEWLGYLTVQSVEPNEAVGVLEGRAPEKVKRQDQVKTQLQ